MNKEYNFNHAQDWVKYFKVIFDNYKVNKLLELGLGDGTEFLLDHCNEVVSLEISVGDYNKFWYDKCIEKYKDYSNWKPVYINAPQEVLESNEIAQKERYPISYSKHIKPLEKILNPYLKKNFDMIFIDAGFHNRGDLVNMCFGKADIIAAHDSSRDPNRILENIYGYNIVKVPEDYKEFHFEDTYMGTTIWLKRDHKLENILSNFSK